ncbi:GntP family permease [uncultured Proteiniphilum sp.]|uniref:GntP family permease n=1 Tax=uncultured Proteiniphilum sp. TaxID=497637 RepID=UPI00261256F2|nr:GntP family permease [uncultured Proteiniphilum sp.]
MSIVTLSILVLLSIVLIVILTSVTKLNAFASLFIVALLLAMIALPDKDVVQILKEGFGSTMASIGFLIIFGAIIAVVLEKTGGAISIANYILSKTGHGKAASAMGITGFVVGLPIFCDSGYIIMSGLAKSFSTKAKIVLPFIAFVLATSLYSVHCLTPTHPGALAASGILNANIGMLILLGTLFAIPAAVAAFFWIKWQTRKDTYKETEPSKGEIGNEEQLPPVSLSLLPIATPLVLIAIGSLLAIMKVPEGNFVLKGLAFIGQPIIALLIGTFLSLFLLKNRAVKSINSILESAIEKAGPILIVTGAGGMFGLVIKETGVGAYAGEFFLQTGLGLAVPFLIASILKTAQGSSTVAIITAASFVAPMLSALELDSETGKLLAMISIGAGSMMVSHANDSYFWVISRFSGINSNTTLKIYSTTTIVMGTVTFLCVWLTSFFIL